MPPVGDGDAKTFFNTKDFGETVTLTRATPSLVVETVGIWELTQLEHDGERASHAIEAPQVTVPKTDPTSGVDLSQFTEGDTVTKGAKVYTILDRLPPESTGEGQVTFTLEEGE